MAGVQGSNPSFEVHEPKDSVSLAAMSTAQNSEFCKDFQGAVFVWRWGSPAVFAGLNASGDRAAGGRVGTGLHEAGPGSQTPATARGDYDATFLLGREFWEHSDENPEERYPVSYSRSFSTAEERENHYRTFHELAT
jgi:hypothetical protein